MLELLQSLLNHARGKFTSEQTALTEMNARGGTLTYSNFTMVS
jgi:hypothetical protein